MTSFETTDQENDITQPAEIPTYPENYTGYVTTITPDLLAGLGGLMHDLNPDYDGSPIAEEALRPQVEEPTLAQVIAIRDGCLAGTASLSLGRELYAGQYVQLGSVVVHPDYRGKKDEDGRAVIDHILEKADDFARGHQARLIMFEVDPANIRAQRAYERWGAEKIGTTFYARHVPQASQSDSH